MDAALTKQLLDEDVEQPFGKVYYGGVFQDSVDVLQKKINLNQLNKIKTSWKLTRFI